MAAFSKCKQLKFQCLFNIFNFMRTFYVLKKVSTTTRTYPIMIVKSNFECVLLCQKKKILIKIDKSSFDGTRASQGGSMFHAEKKLKWRNIDHRSRWFGIAHVVFLFSVKVFFFVLSLKTLFASSIFLHNTREPHPFLSRFICNR
jgi:hypothetical protein